MRIVLAGNPNVGKSTIFNKLTGLHQHTGNWTGKTVENAYGEFFYNNLKYEVIDLPGTYSLYAHSKEEEVARDFICFEEYDAIIVVCDATCLERNLILLLQILQITNKVILCVNLIDEALKKHITIDTNLLSNILRIPVVALSARNEKNLDKLLDATLNLETANFEMKYDEEIENCINYISSSFTNVSLNSRFISLSLINDYSFIHSLQKYVKEDMISDIRNKIIEINENANVKNKISLTIVSRSEEIAKQVVKIENIKYIEKEKKIDRVLTNKLTGIPIMIMMLIGILFLTITFANYPSNLLFKIFSQIQVYLLSFMSFLHFPNWLIGLIIDGIYKVLTWVISVMLPPMAIFFPLFTLLEDFGLLPRIAFNLDGYFKKANSCGKQALTMCMGLGCNAVGVTGARIIDSPRERLIAILTNVFTPCNGRFPTIISIITMFFVGFNVGLEGKLVSTLILVLCILLGIILTLVISFVLSKTILKGIPTSFVLELPPYRKPQIGKVIVRSLLDRTLIILCRTIKIAIPAGAIIWCLGNIYINNINLFTYISQVLNPAANLLGLDGVILLAFILGFPANEIVIPIIIMGYLSTGTIVELENLEFLKLLFINNGWTVTTAICVIVFTLCHFPCSTTCLTIKKETNSVKWTLISILIPTLTGTLLCLIINSISLLF